MGLMLIRACREIDGIHKASGGKKEKDKQETGKQMFAYSWHVCVKERRCVCVLVLLFFLPNQCLIHWLIVIE